MSGPYRLERFSPDRGPAAAARGCRLPDPRILARDGPQETWLVRDPRGAVGACASLWWTATAPVGGRPSGYIGHYDAADRAAARQLLRQLCRRLRLAGCGIAVGPVDGSTWRGYRLVTDPGKRPPFLLEPWTPREWVSDFEDAGFAAIATYHSSVTTRLDYRDPALARVERRLSRQGVTVRRPNPAHLGDEMRAIHALACDSFAGNFLYTPLSCEAFAAAYRGFGDHAEDLVVLLAERQGALVGFAFAVADAAARRHGRAADTLILKTVAVRPERGLAGLGRLLILEVNRQAARNGYRAVIHALMHDRNASAAYSARFAGVIRRYALYGRALT